MFLPFMLSCLLQASLFLSKGAGVLHVMVLLIGLCSHTNSSYLLDAAMNMVTGSLFLPSQSVI